MKRLRERLARLCGVVAALFIAAMMLLTVVDVALRAVSNLPIRGTYELIELLLACSFFFALPAAFLRDDNIVVDLIDGFVPRLVSSLKRIGAAIAVLILIVLSWQGFSAARDSVEFNDVTADLGLPRILHWAALLIGLVGAAIAALVMALRRNGRK
jgi:TRAP-type C4-dicarboxylate transport system permease small subunit